MSYFTKLMEQTGLSYGLDIAAPSWSLNPVPKTQGVEPLQVVEEERVAENIPTRNTTPLRHELGEKLSPELLQGVRVEPFSTQSVLEKAPTQKSGDLKSAGPVLDPSKQRTEKPIPLREQPLGSFQLKDSSHTPPLEKPLEDIRIIEKMMAVPPQTPSQTMETPLSRNPKSVMRPLSMPEQKKNHMTMPIQQIVEQSQAATPGSQMPGEKPLWEKQTETPEREEVPLPGVVLKRVREWVSQTPAASEQKVPTAVSGVEREIHTRDQEIRIEKPLRMKQVQLSIGAINLTIEGDLKPKTETIKTRPKTKPDRPALSDTKLSRYYLR